MRQLFNFHTHTSRCGHAVGSDEDYVKAAIKAGYRVLGFSDHAPYRNYPNKRVHMNWDELDDYISSISQLKEKYKDQIEIHLGLESEFFPETLEERKYLRDRVEYLLLGQHFHNVEGTRSYFANVSDDMIMDYARAVVQGLDSGLFTYLCHPDVFMNRQEEFTPACAEAARMIARKCVETNTPVEINLKGVMKGKKPFPDGWQYYYPNKDFWTVMAEYPVKCVIGVDAHDPAELLDLASVDNAYRELADLNLEFCEVII